MPYAQINDCHLHYIEKGTGDPIIFLHGFTLDCRMWQPQVEFFANPANFEDRHYRVIALDSRGHGKSDAPQSGYSRAHRVEDLVQFADKLELERFHLVGLSMGGTTGIGFALKYQARLKSLSLVSSAIAGYSVGKKISRLDNIAREKGIQTAKEKWKMMTLTYYKPEQAEIKQLMAQMVDDHSGSTWADPMRGKYPRVEDLPRLGEIKVPTAVFVGQNDKIFHGVGKIIHEHIPSSEWHSYEGVGHIVSLELPARCNIDLKLFLEGTE